MLKDSKIVRSKYRFDNPEGFSGPLAKQCREFVLQKRALGLKYSVEAGLLGRFDRYLRDSGAPENALSKEDVVSFAAKRQDESDKTFYARGLVLRQFGEYMGRMGYRSYVLPYYVKHTSSFVPYIFTHDEIIRIFNELDKAQHRSKSKYSHKVFPMLFRLLYGCGLRIGEALALNSQNIDCKNGIIRLENTKWNAERLVPMSDSLLTECRRYYNELHSTGQFKHFFPSSRFDDTAVSNSSVSRELKRVLKICGISEKVRIHDFRHTYGVHLLNKWASDGKDIYSLLPNLSRYVGHRKISATEDYLRLTAEVYPEVTQIFENYFGGVIPEVKTFEKI